MIRQSVLETGSKPYKTSFSTDTDFEFNLVKAQLLIKRLKMNLSDAAPHELEFLNDGVIEQPVHEIKKELLNEIKPQSLLAWMFSGREPPAETVRRTDVYLVSYF